MKAAAGEATTQEADAYYFTLGDEPLLATIATWFPPVLIGAGISLKDFIRSDEFIALRRRHGDLRAVDAIYVRAMKLTSNNTAAALMITTGSVFDHYIVGIRNPVFALYFPLSNESRDEFDARVENLPVRLYADSPDHPGDRDKLQHFFGSAAASLTFESGTVADRIGDFVEIGEDVAIIDGVFDSRDRRANWQGRQFGLALLENINRMPSEFFVTPIAAGTAAPGAAWAPAGDAADASWNGGCR